MKTIHVISFLLVIIAGLNLGLLGLFNLDLVKSVLGGVGLEKLFNILVGLSAVILVLAHKGDCKSCVSK